MTWRLRAAAAVGAAFLAVQLVPPARTNPAVTGDVAAPPAVAPLLRRACYDCHSNETVWPWYARVAPPSWLVAHDVREGRDELNFSTWTAYDAARQRKKLRETADQVADGDMPPWYYVLLHPEAKLSPAATETLRAWALAGAGAPAGDGGR